MYFVKVHSSTRNYLLRYYITIQVLPNNHTIDGSNDSIFLAGEYVSTGSLPLISVAGGNYFVLIDLGYYRIYSILQGLWSNENEEIRMIFIVYRQNITLNTQPFPSWPSCVPFFSPRFSGITSFFPSLGPFCPFFHTGFFFFFFFPLFFYFLLLFPTFSLNFIYHPLSLSFFFSFFLSSS